MVRLLIILLIAFNLSGSFANEIDFEIVSSIESPCNSPMGLAFDGELLWTIDGRTKELYGFSPVNGEVISKFKLDILFGIGVSYYQGNLIVIDARSKEVITVLIDSGEIVSRVPIALAQPTGLESDNNHIWVNNSKGSGSVHIYNSDFSEIRSFSSPGKNPFGMALSKNCLWVTNNSMQHSGSVHCLDPISGKERGMFTFKESPKGYLNGLEIAMDHLWIISNNTDTVYKLKIDNRFLTRF